MANKEISELKSQVEYLQAELNANIDKVYTQEEMNAASKEKAILFLDNIRDYEREAGIQISDDERTSEELYQIKYDKYLPSPNSEWVRVEDRLPEEGRLVELATIHNGVKGYARSLEIYKVENMYQEKKTLCYRGCISKCTWDLIEWSHWRYHNENDLPSPPTQTNK